MAKPFSQKYFYRLLIKACHADISGDKFAVKYLRTAARAARKAYIIGQSEKRAGRTPAPFKDMPTGSSVLEQNAWRFVYECYLIGHNRKE